MPLLIIFIVAIGIYCFFTFDKPEYENINVVKLILAILSFAGLIMLLDYITH